MLRWALAIGRTPRELLASVTSAEMTEMMAFDQLEPFGSLADEFRLGQIAAVAANVNRNEERRPEPFTAADFMPALAAARERANRPPEDETPEQTRARLDRKLFDAHKG